MLLSARAERHLAEMTKTFKRAQRNYEQLGGAIDEVLSSSEKQSLERYTIVLLVR